VPSYNLLQQPVSAITPTPAVPLYPPTDPDQFASGSTQPSNFCGTQAVIRRMIWGQELTRCPVCYAASFPSAWTMEFYKCMYCELQIPRAMLSQPVLLPPPAPAPAPTATADRPRSPSTCPFQSRSRKGKSPQTRGRRAIKPPSPVAQEFRCCPFTSSGNISLPCPHISCSPPPGVGLLSRRFEENEKWEKARKEAVASFSYEDCGCTSTYPVSLCTPLFIIHQPTLILSLQTSDRSHLDNHTALPTARLFLYAIDSGGTFCIQSQIRSSSEFDRSVEMLQEDILQHVLGDIRNRSHVSTEAHRGGPQPI
jgi:hypothetical protein